VKGRRPAAVLVGSVGLAVLASEYPERFCSDSRELPSYVRRDAVLDLAIKIGGKIEEFADKRARARLRSWENTERRWRTTNSERRTADSLDSQLFAASGLAVPESRRVPENIDVGVADAGQLLDSGFYLALMLTCSGQPWAVRVMSTVTSCWFSGRRETNLVDQA